MTIDDAVPMEVDDSGEAKFTQGSQAEAPSPSGGEQSSAAEETSNKPGAESEGQQSAKRVRAEFQGKTYEFEFENHEILCAAAVRLFRVRSLVATSAVFHSAKRAPNQRPNSTKHRASIKSPRSEMASIKQALRGAPQIRQTDQLLHRAPA